jgi:hypothetical protein
MAEQARHPRYRVKLRLKNKEMTSIGAKPNTAVVVEGRRGIDDRK